MHYRSLADMSATLRRQAWRLPQPVELVVGIPRSGLLAANLLSLMLNVPMTDLEGFLEGRILATGRRRTNAGRQTPDVGRVLVVDDSVLTGSAMRAAQARINASGCIPPTYVAVYGEDYHSSDVNIVLEKVPAPRVFEWNVMHHPILEEACIDIDGVLCVDPTKEENDDGPAYQRFLREASPLWVPSKPIAELVTSRLEKYRDQTEEWLQRYGIQYGKLHMMDLPDAASRRASASYGAFKGEVYARSPATLFIESDHDQALEITEQSGKPTLCMCCGELVRPEGVHELRYYLRSGKRATVAKVKWSLRRMFGHRTYERLKRSVVR